MYKKKKLLTKTDKRLRKVFFVLCIVEALLLGGAFMWYIGIPVLKILLYIFCWPYFLYLDPPSWAGGVDGVDVLAFIFFQTFMVCLVIALFT